MDSVGFGDWVVGSRTSPLHLVGRDTPWGAGVGIVAGRPFPRLHPRGQVLVAERAEGPAPGTGGDRCPLRYVPQGPASPTLIVSPALVSLVPETDLLLFFSHSVCPTLCDPMDCSTPGFPVLHSLPEFAQTHVH